MQGGPDVGAAEGVPNTNLIRTLHSRDETGMRKKIELERVQARTSNSDTIRQSEEFANGRSDA